MKYEASEAIPLGYFTNFVRQGSELLVDNTGHVKAARNGGILDDILRRRLEEPETVDGGWIVAEEGEMVVDGFSSGLKLPVDAVAARAREITIAVFKQESPGINVRAANREVSG